MLLESLIETEEEAHRAAAHQAKLEALAVRAGGITGLGSIGNAYAEAPAGVGA
jgi:hypothetical protein